MRKWRTLVLMNKYFLCVGYAKLKVYVSLDQERKIHGQLCFIMMTNIVIFFTTQLATY